MAFMIKYIIERILIVMLLTISSQATYFDCYGRPFHCVNTTHFMICVDLGTGLSTTIDDFVIPCPSSTVCQPTNHFECEFPESISEPELSTITISDVIESDATVFNPLMTTSVPLEEYYNTFGTSTVSEIELKSSTTGYILPETLVTKTANIPKSDTTIAYESTISSDTSLREISGNADANIISYIAPTTFSNKVVQQSTSDTPLTVEQSKEIINIMNTSKSNTVNIAEVVTTERENVSATDDANSSSVKPIVSSDMNTDNKVLTNLDVIFYEATTAKVAYKSFTVDNIYKIQTTDNTFEDKNYNQIKTTVTDTDNAVTEQRLATDEILTTKIPKLLSSEDTLTTVPLLDTSQLERHLDVSGSATSTYNLQGMDTQTMNLNKNISDINQITSLYDSTTATNVLYTTNVTDSFDNQDISLVNGIKNTAIFESTTLDTINENSTNPTFTDTIIATSKVSNTAYLQMSDLQNSFENFNTTSIPLNYSDSIINIIDIENPSLTDNKNGDDNMITSTDARKVSDSTANTIYSTEVNPNYSNVTDLKINLTTIPYLAKSTNKSNSEIYIINVKAEMPIEKSFHVSTESQNFTAAMTNVDSVTLANTTEQIITEDILSVFKNTMDNESTPFIMSTTKTDVVMESFNNNLQTLTNSSNDLTNTVELNTENITSQTDWENISNITNVYVLNNSSSHTENFYINSKNGNITHEKVPTNYVEITAGNRTYFENKLNRNSKTEATSTSINGAVQTYEMLTKSSVFVQTIGSIETEPDSEVKVHIDLLNKTSSQIENFDNIPKYHIKSTTSRLVSNKNVTLTDHDDIKGSTQTYVENILNINNSNETSSVKTINIMQEYTPDSSKLNQTYTMPVISNYEVSKMDIESLNKNVLHRENADQTLSIPITTSPLLSSIGSYTTDRSTLGITNQIYDNTNIASNNEGSVIYTESLVVTTNMPTKLVRNSATDITDTDSLSSFMKHTEATPQNANTVIDIPPSEIVTINDMKKILMEKNYPLDTSTFTPSTEIITSGIKITPNLSKDIKKTEVPKSLDNVEKNEESLKSQLKTSQDTSFSSMTHPEISLNTKSVSGTFHNTSNSNIIGTTFSTPVTDTITVELTGSSQQNYISTDRILEYIVKSSIRSDLIISNSNTNSVSTKNSSIVSPDNDTDSTIELHKSQSEIRRTLDYGTKMQLDLHPSENDNKVDTISSNSDIVISNDGIAEITATSLNVRGTDMLETTTLTTDLLSIAYNQPTGNGNVVTEIPMSAIVNQPENQFENNTVEKIANNNNITVTERSYNYLVNNETRTNLEFPSVPKANINSDNLMRDFNVNGTGHKKSATYAESINNSRSEIEPLVNLLVQNNASSLQNHINPSAISTFSTLMEPASTLSINTKIMEENGKRTTVKTNIQSIKTKSDERILPFKILDVTALPYEESLKLNDDNQELSSTILLLQAATASVESQRQITTESTLKIVTEQLVESGVTTPFHLDSTIDKSKTISDTQTIKTIIDLRSILDQESPYETKVIDGKQKLQYLPPLLTSKAKVETFEEINLQGTLTKVKPQIVSVTNPELEIKMIQTNIPENSEVTPVFHERINSEIEVKDITTVSPSVGQQLRKEDTKTITASHHPYTKDDSFNTVQESSAPNNTIQKNNKDVSSSQLTLSIGSSNIDVATATDVVKIDILVSNNNGRDNVHSKIISLLTKPLTIKTKEETEKYDNTEITHREAQDRPQTLRKEYVAATSTKPESIIKFKNTTRGFDVVKSSASSSTLKPGENNVNGIVFQETSMPDLIENGTIVNHNNLSNSKSKGPIKSMLDEHGPDVISNDYRYMTRTNSTSFSEALTDEAEFPTTESTIKPQTNIFSCEQKQRGRYADVLDCRKFFICVGNNHVVKGTCPVNTVFSEIKKQCTKNLSHCIRNNQFRCTTEGHFSDFLNDNVYYICVKKSAGYFIRFKLQCLNGYHLDKTSVRCVWNMKSEQSSSNGGSSKNNSDERGQSQNYTKETKEENEKSDQKFICEKEGTFPDPSDCNRYFACTKTDNSYRQKRKKCDSGETFHKDKKKCVDDDSYECN